MQKNTIIIKKVNIKQMSVEKKLISNVILEKS